MNQQKITAKLVLSEAKYGIACRLENWLNNNNL